MIDREKVIRAVETCFDSWIDKHQNMDLDLHEVEQMKQDALELLREQKPVKPDYDSYYQEYFCGNCGETITRAYNFCNYCGRKVKWNAVD